MKRVYPLTKKPPVCVPTLYDQEKIKLNSPGKRYNKRGQKHVASQDDHLQTQEEGYGTDGGNTSGEDGTVGENLATSVEPVTQHSLVRRTEASRMQ